MIIKPRYNGPQLPTTYAVTMTAAGSGSNGITVADAADIDFGTGDFFLHWEGSLPDWTPNSGAQDLINKLSAAVGYRLVIGSTALGFPIVVLNATAYTASAANTITNGAIAKITAVIVREAASADGSITFYIGPSQHGTPVAISAGVPATISNAVSEYISGTSSMRTASNTISCIVGNFAPTAAEVLDLCTNGIPESWKWGSQAATTSWTWNNFGGGAGYETFTTSGSDITSAINSSGLGIASAAYSFTASKKYQIKLNITVNSGTVQIKANPTTDLSSGGQEIAIITSANDGELTITFTSASAYTRLGFYSPSSSNFSVTGFEIKRAGATFAALPETIPTSGALAWTDSSGNTAGGTLPAAGASKVTIRK